MIHKNIKQERNLPYKINTPIYIWPQNNMP